MHFRSFITERYSDRERNYFADREGTTHKYSLRERRSFSPLVSTVTSLSGGQSPMLNVFDTIRVPGSKSWSSFGRRRKLRLDNRNRVTTVASWISALNRSFSSNRTKLSTPAFLALLLDSRMRRGSMSMPTPLAP